MRRGRTVSAAGLQNRVNGALAVVEEQGGESGQGWKHRHLVDGLHQISHLVEARLRVRGHGLGVHMPTNYFSLWPSVTLLGHLEDWRADGVNRVYLFKPSAETVAFALCLGQ